MPFSIHTCRTSDFYATVLTVSIDVLCYDPVVQEHVGTRDMLDSLISQEALLIIASFVKISRKTERNRLWVS